MSEKRRLSVAFGAFQCEVEGYDDPFAVMSEVVRSLREALDEDPNFGAAAHEDSDAASQRGRDLAIVASQIRAGQAAEAGALEAAETTPPPAAASPESGPAEPVEDDSARAAADRAVEGPDLAGDDAEDGAPGHGDLQYPSLQGGVSEDSGAIAEDTGGAIAGEAAAGAAPDAPVETERADAFAGALPPRATEPFLAADDGADHPNDGAGAPPPETVAGPAPEPADAAPQPVPTPSKKPVITLRRSGRTPALRPDAASQPLRPAPAQGGGDTPDHGAAPPPPPNAAGPGASLRDEPDDRALQSAEDVADGHFEENIADAAFAQASRDLAELESRAAPDAREDRSAAPEITAPAAFDAPTPPAAEAPAPAEPAPETSERESRLRSAQETPRDGETFVSTRPSPLRSATQPVMNAKVTSFGAAADLGGLALPAAGPARPAGPADDDDEDDNFLFADFGVEEAAAPERPETSEAPAAPHAEAEDAPEEAELTPAPPPIRDRKPDLKLHEPAMEAAPLRQPPLEAIRAHLEEEDDLEDEDDAFEARRDVAAPALDDQKRRGFGLGRLLGGRSAPAPPQGPGERFGELAEIAAAPPPEGSGGGSLKPFITRRTGENAPTRPMPVSSDGEAVAISVAEFAQRVGAESLHELLEASAAYTAIVEGKNRFSRKDVLLNFDELETSAAHGAEARLKCFRKLLTTGAVVRAEDGMFAMSRTARYGYEAQLRA